MTITSELQIFIWVAGALLAVNILAMVLFVLFAKLPHGWFKLMLQEVIYHVDAVADHLENKEKRERAIRGINDILGWRRILIPTVLIGWIIDAEVAAIRKMQRATDCPDLHKEGENND